MSLIGQRGDVVLRVAHERDLPAIDVLTETCYAPIQASFVAMLGEDCYVTVQADPHESWAHRKAAQNRRLFAEHPRRAYEAAGFDRKVPTIDLWQRL